jgi:tRNA U34 5-methylaminomethyl-2-thiouridine-forming methyltransferase MnmC
MKSIEIIATGDDSHTLYLPHLDETYHSRHGAIRESQYVFIEKGLRQVFNETEKPVQLLELGFGTGLNAFLTMIEAVEHQRKVDYTTLEPFPLPSEIVESLNYGNFLPADSARLFQKIHQAPWENPIDLDPAFILLKLKTIIQNFQPEQLYDLVYFDAFAPAKQPELWDFPVLEHVYGLLNSGGYLVTYCAQGKFQRNLRELGMKVEKLPGPPGKREMIRARKC